MHHPVVLRRTGKQILWHLSDTLSHHVYASINIHMNPHTHTHIHPSKTFKYIRATCLYWPAAQVSTHRARQSDAIIYESCSDRRPINANTPVPNSIGINASGLRSQPSVDLPYGISHAVTLRQPTSAAAPARPPCEALQCPAHRCSHRRTSRQ
jgi:hypothetical protein